MGHEIKRSNTGNCSTKSRKKDPSLHDDPQAERINLLYTYLASFAHRNYQMVYAQKSRGLHGNLGQRHKQPDHIALTAGAGLIQHALYLLADCAGRDTAQAGDLLG